MNSIIGDILQDADFKYVIFEEISNDSQNSENTDYRIIEYSNNVENILPIECSNTLNEKTLESLRKQHSGEYSRKSIDQICLSLRQPGISLPYYNEKTKTWYKLHTLKAKGNYLLLQCMDDTPDKIKNEDILHDYEQHKLLSDLTIEGIFIHTNGIIDFANLSLLQMIGYKNEEVVGKNLINFIHPKDQEKAINYISIKKSEPYELKIFHKDGSLIYVEVEARNFITRNQERRVVAVRDLTERKIEAIRRRERDVLFSRITDNMTDVIWTADLDLNTTYVSPSVHRILLESPEEHSQKSIEQKYTPESLANIYAIFQEEMEKEKNSNACKNRSRYVESEHYRGDGTTIWVSENISFLRDEEGKAIGFVGVLRDISEKRETERILLENENKFRKITETIHDVVYNINDQGVFTYLSPSLTTMLGYEVHEVMGASLATIVHPDHVGPCRDFILQAIESGQMISGIEYLVRHKNGSWRWHTSSISPISDPHGKLTGLIGNASDITERKAYEEKLKESENRFNALINAMEEIVFIKDADLTYIYSNPALEKFFNLPKEEILGKTDYELMPAEAADICYTSDKQAIEAKKAIVSVEIVNNRHLETHKFPITLSNGSTGIGCYIADVTDRRNADKELAEKTELLENITENMFDLVSLTDFHGNILYFNKSHEVFGYSTDEMLEINAFSLVHPEDHNTIGLPFYKDIIKGLSSSAEYRFRCADGSYLWVETIGKALQDENGRIKNLLFSSRDITARKKLENTLREREAHLQVMIENPFESIWSVNTQGELTYINENHLKAFETVFGVKPQKGQKVIDYLPESIIPLWEERYRRLFQGEKFLTEDFFIHDGNSLFIEVAANPIIIDEKITGACFYGRNISERKLTELKLKRLAELQNLLMNLASEFINLNTDQLEDAIKVALEKLGTFVLADRAYIFEYDWANKSCNNTYEWCAPGINSFIDDLKDVSFDQMYILPEKHHRHEPVIITQVSDLPADEPLRSILDSQNIQSIINLPIIDDGKCIGFIGFDNRYKTNEYMEEELNLLRVFTEIYVNLVQRQRLHKNLIKEKNKSDAANKAKSEFLANMSHEIRTPLNGVLGFTDLLLKSGLEDHQRQYAENANIAGKSLLGIINDILDFSKIEAGKLEIENQRINLHQMVNEVSDIVKYLAGAKEIELLLNIPATLPEFIQADPVRLKQILINLLNNAIKFTEKGEVELSLQLTEVSPGLGDFQFIIRDTGIGISEEQQRNLFKAFSQADSSTTRKFGGSGLGLTISKLLAEKMNGSIQLYSEKGQGSTFTLTIRTEFSIETLKPSNLQYSKVLIADDNEKASEIAIQIFKTLGSEVITTDNGISAIKFIEKNHFDLIVIDQEMPYFDGLETLQKLRSENFDPSKLPPVWLLINPSKDLLDDHTCQQLGIQHQISKPLSLSKILKITAPPSVTEMEDDGVEFFMEITKEKERSNYSILIAEDVPMNMVLIKTIVMEILPEAKIHEASNGKEAVSIVSQHPVDLVLMDIQMPEMDGYEATRRIREMEGHTGRRLPVFALTAGALKEERDKALENGMDEFLTKPLEVEKIQEVFLRYLNMNPQTIKVNSENGKCHGNMHFDKEAFLKKFNNNERLLKNLAKMCIEDIPRNLKNLELAVEEADCKKIKLAAHTLKGQALNMMFNPMAELCSQIEINASNACALPVQSKLEQVKAEWQSVLEELQQIA